MDDKHQESPGEQEMQERQSQPGEPQQAQQGSQPKVTRIALDQLEFGDDSHFEKSVRGNHALPDGLTNRMLYGDVVRIAWPSLVELLLVQLTSMADLIMVGVLGELAISAVGYTTQPKMLLGTMFMALNVGTTAMVARARGAGNRERAQLILRQALMMNTLIGVTFSVLGFFFAEQLVRFIGATTPETIANAVAYFKIQMVGFLSIAITSAITASLRAIGNSRTSMIYNTTANLVNVVFNYLLIGGRMGFPRWGVAGASVATVMGQVVAMCMAISVVFRKDSYLYVELSKGFWPHRETIATIFRIGIPSMAEQLIMRAGVILYTRTVATLGDMLMATHQICMNIQSITMMNGQAFAVSATSLVGQSLGKRRGDMAAFYANRTQRVGMFVAFAIGSAIFLFAPQLMDAYADDPLVISSGAAVLRMVAIIQPLQVAQFVMAGVLRGAGDTRYTAMVVFVTILFVRPLIAMYTIHTLNWGLNGAWVAMVSDQLMRTVLVLGRYNSGKWRTIARTIE